MKAKKYFGQLTNYQLFIEDLRHALKSSHNLSPRHLTAKHHYATLDLIPHNTISCFTKSAFQPPIRECV